LEAIASLLSSLEQAAAESGLATHDARQAMTIVRVRENKLAAVRSGVVQSLFLALRSKHSPTASHSLRVAINCSAWATFAKLDDESRDVLELAALMHELGKLGIPDAILNKPGRLTETERRLMREAPAMAVDILSGCCTDQRVLDAVRYAGYRYDGQGNASPLAWAGIPAEARRLAIVDAFDAMVTHQLYRPARSREGALTELFSEVGRQFDPEYVQQFAALLSGPYDEFCELAAERWLSSLQVDSRALPWQRDADGPAAETQLPAASVDRRGGPDRRRTSRFEQKLVEAMHDGVAFVDDQARILLWNQGAARLAEVNEEALLGRVLEPGLLEMTDELGCRLEADECPLRRALVAQTQVRQRVLLRGRKRIAVDLHVLPVNGPDGACEGATILLYDAQRQVQLERRCEALHEEATKDPLTKVANRAEFDRMHAVFVGAHRQAGSPCSLIMVDIDHFKSINDCHGHQAGDAAIITVARLLESMCRTGDVVARYGGEEFAVLCANCSNADAARRADELRRRLAATTHAELGGQAFTASFGVTEYQPGDTCETMLRRADRALLQAKDAGRNRVVQLGTGSDASQSKLGSWWSFGKSSLPLVETLLSTPVPIDLAIQKLRGFIVDHKAIVLKTESNCVELEISCSAASSVRSDRHGVFLLALEFDEHRARRTIAGTSVSSECSLTAIRVVVRQKKSRLLRGPAEPEAVAQRIVASLRAYLMASEMTRQ
jgi:diguanylate cyclase (GGDEF)-like protein